MKKNKTPKRQILLRNLLIIDFLLCAVTKAVQIVGYRKMGPLLLLSCALLYYVYQGKDWAVLLYHGTTVFLLIPAASGGICMIGKIVNPASLASGHFLLGTCYILFFAVHVAISLFLAKGKHK